MPIPKRTRNNNGTFRRKRSDIGKSRYTLIVLDAITPEKIESVLEEYRKAGIKYKETN